MKTLKEIYARHVAAGQASDKGTVHSYIEVYEDLFAPYRHTANRVLEVGLFNGYSMRLWEEYFTKAEVHGIDLCDQPHDGLADLRPMIAEKTHHILLFDAANPVEVEKHFANMLFDVIVEDANHSLGNQQAIYQNLRKHLAPGGLYVIEDIADLERDRSAYKALSPSIQFIDRRTVKRRFDDVLGIIRS